MLKRFLRKFQSQQQYLFPDEIVTLRHDCEALIDKYELLLERITRFMSTQSNALEVRQQEQTKEFYFYSANSFALFPIKDELEQITQECESLFNQAETHPSEVKHHKEAMSILKDQLENLKKYSVQIEGTLSEFEKKLFEIEEVFSEQTYSN